MISRSIDGGIALHEDTNRSKVRHRPLTGGESHDKSNGLYSRMLRGSQYGNAYDRRVGNAPTCSRLPSLST